MLGTFATFRAAAPFSSQTVYKNHYNLLLLGRLKIPGCYNKIKTKYDEREEDCGQTFKHCWSQRWARETGDKRKDIGDVRHEI